MTSGQVTTADVQSLWTKLKAFSETLTLAEQITFLDILRRAMLDQEEVQAYFFWSELWDWLRANQTGDQGLAHQQAW